MRRAPVKTARPSPLAMLREIPNTRQIAGEPRRRWFCSHEQDLYIWYNEAQGIVAFQLCYGKPRDERAIYWKTGTGFSHLRVDDGEGSGLAANTPILLADGHFDRDSVLERFCQLAGELPEAELDFVRSQLAGYPSRSANGTA